MEKSETSGLLQFLNHSFSLPMLQNQQEDEKIEPVPLLKVSEFNRPITEEAKLNYNENYNDLKCLFLKEHKEYKPFDNQWAEGHVLLELWHTDDNDLASKSPRRDRMQCLWPIL